MIDWHTLYIDAYGAVESQFSNMVVAERKNRTALDKFDSFGEMMTDGRLTMPSDGKIYRLREAILLSKKLGRPLSEEEMKQFAL